MIAEAYLVLTICSYKCNNPTEFVHRSISISSQTIPQPSMDQCIIQANAFNKQRIDARAMCVKGDEK